MKVMRLSIFVVYKHSFQHDLFSSYRTGGH